MPAPIGWGILGTGRIARKLAPVFCDGTDRSLVAVGSRQAVTANAFRDEFQPAAAYGDYRAVLDDARVTAVYIALPPSMHEEWTLLAAHAGKHVLCEKPLANSLAAARRMVEACAAARVVLMDGMQWLHHPRTIEMQQRIRDGELGRIQRVTAAFTFVGDQLAADDFRFSAELGGGCLLDLGWYCVAAILWAMGESPVRVWGTASPREGAPRSCAGLLEWPDGRTAAFDAGFDTMARRWLEIAGERGSLVCDDFTRPWNLEKTRYWQHDRDGAATERRFPAMDQRYAMVETFERRVREGGFAELSQLPLAVQGVCERLAEAALR